MPPRPLACLIAAGGTAGHVLPSLAVAEALQRQGVRVTFAGSTRPATRLVREAGYELDVFRIEGIPRTMGPALARALGVALASIPACLGILRRRRPDVVLGGGGYVAGPVVLAAAMLRIPSALMEADAHLGLANRLAAPVAKRVFLAFPLPGRTTAKYRVVGRPIPARAQPTERAPARSLFGLPDEGPVVLVFGGSQGARRLNEAAIEAFAAGGPAVLHLCGERDFETLRGRVSRPGYVLLPFTNEFGAALAAADLVVARAGGSVWEVAAAGKPALLVPYPFATADHQTKNARYFESGGGAVVVAEPDLDLRHQVEGLLADRDRLARMASAMRALARPAAADVIAEDVVALASRAPRGGTTGGTA
ncbi:MAG: UDP-N-acetylglucosamine--N-acetylmuramyl-(pentapeptide) pyrophosphoryl-undecaprenol N-acetylglucosamine transferase [Actinomycetota bacterium]|nr:UDP-N-acetylglucosamine--N-acetylmuramyl-(pentapeptide) pyrophosphoryl-undecaprenol N-acetylglucosamine transferase [Actinomycetota bacterium]